jgi:hypothetical protein
MSCMPFSAVSDHRDSRAMKRSAEAARRGQNGREGVGDQNRAREVKIFENISLDSRFTSNHCLWWQLIYWAGEPSATVDGGGGICAIDAVICTQ